jgi:hypothetical protein
MKKGLEIIFLGVFMVLLMPFFVASEACSHDPLIMKDACYNNFPISSDTGFGAAEICTTCYKCGVQDGVCLEDFATAGSFYRGNCSECNDPDCSATLSGYVYRRETYSGANREPVAGALVKAVPTNPHFLFWENMTTTDTFGHYTLTIPSGRIVVSASKVGLDTEIVEIMSTSRDEITHDFFLPNASCDENCTNYFGRCNKDCQGINGCNYADWDGSESRIAELCHEHKYGDFVIINYEQEQTTNAVCCKGSDQFVTRSPRFFVSGKMKDLITSEIPALYGSVPVRVVIAVWPS